MLNPNPNANANANSDSESVAESVAVADSSDSVSVVNESDSTRSGPASVLPSVSVSSNSVSSESVTRTPLQQFYALKRVLFAPDVLEKNFPVIQSASELATTAGFSPVFNFDPENFPVDKTIAVIPLQRRVKGIGMVNSGLCIGALASVDDFCADKLGKSWLESLLHDELIKQIKKSANKPAEDITSIACSVSDFISTQKSAIETFNSLANDVIDLLKELSPKLSILKKPMFKNVLSNAQFAAATFPTATQEQWEKVLNMMINTAKDEKLDPAIFTHWLETRDQIEVDDTEIDLSALDNLSALGDEAENEEEENEAVENEVAENETGEVVENEAVENVDEENVVAS